MSGDPVVFDVDSVGCVLHVVSTSALELDWDFACRWVPARAVGRCRCTQARTLHLVDAERGLSPQILDTPAERKTMVVLGEAGLPGCELRRLVNGLFQRYHFEMGLLTVHAAAVSWRGEGLLLVGPPGAGKTSVALAMSQRGAEIVADDIVLVRLPVADQKAYILPGREPLMVRPRTLSKHFPLLHDYLVCESRRAATGRVELRPECNDKQSQVRRQECVLSGVALVSLIDPGDDVEFVRLDGEDPNARFDLNLWRATQFCQDLVLPSYDLPLSLLESREGALKRWRAVAALVGSVPVWRVVGSLEHVAERLIGALSTELQRA